MANLFDGLNLPQSEYLPPEYGQQVLEQLDLGQQRTEAEGMRRFLEGINAMGRLYSGSALRGGIEQVLGPAQERRQQLLGNVALQGIEARRGERLTGEERSYQSAEARAARDWQAAQNELNRQMQERQFALQMAEQRRAQRTGRRLSTSINAALPGMLTGAAAYGLGGLPSLMFGGGGGGSMPSFSMPSYGLPTLPAPAGTNMFGRNLGYGDYSYGG